MWFFSRVCCTQIVQDYGEPNSRPSREEFYRFFPPVILQFVFFLV